MRRLPWFVWTLFVVVVAVAAVVIIRPFSSNDDGLLWSDEFNGSQGSAPNAAIWHHATGGNGWGNGELECYTDSTSNAALDGKGDLVITARSDPGHACAGGTTNNFTSARLLTQNLKTFEYGKVRVRAKLPTAPGTWPAVWALGVDHETAGWPRSGEIDIVEKVGTQPTQAHGTLHGPNSAGQPYAITAETTETGTPGATFHVYGINWSPDSVSFLVDNHVYQTVTRAQAEKSGTWEFDKPFYLLLNLAVGGDWPGAPTAATPWPQRMVVDYVRIYR